MKIYQISGLGANQKVFSRLQINPNFKTVYIPWLQPEKNESISHYSERMSSKINFNEDFILMGLSFGGIIAQEVNNFITAKHNFLISTVKSEHELPTYIKLSSKINAHKLIPINFIASDAIISYTVFRKLYYTKKNMSINDVFEYKDKYYLKWSIDSIVSWKNNNPIKNYTHIHGDNDIVFPSKHLKNAHIIKGGSHIMVLQKHKTISSIINSELERLLQTS